MMTCTQLMPWPRAGPTRKLIIVEGFLVFMNKEILSLIDKHIFISIERSVARQRRSVAMHLVVIVGCGAHACSRRIETTGTPGWYFDKLIWPNYLKYHKNVLALPHPLLVIDGQLDQRSIVQLAIDFIEGRQVDDAAHRVKLKEVLQGLQPPSMLSWF